MAAHQEEGHLHRHRTEVPGLLHHAGVVQKGSQGRLDELAGLDLVQHEGRAGVRVAHGGGDAVAAGRDVQRGECAQDGDRGRRDAHLLVGLPQRRLGDALAALLCAAGKGHLATVAAAVLGAQDQGQVQVQRAAVAGRIEQDQHAALLGRLAGRRLHAAGPRANDHALLGGGSGQGTAQRGGDAGRGSWAGEARRENRQAGRVGCRLAGWCI